jgi:glucose-6-phosphate dehydrogenase assembly protein OpcA
VTTHGLQEEAIEAANDASREHPMRVIVLIANVEGDAKLDAQIRVGGDAGASEVIVLRAHGPAAASQEGLITGLLLPDAPVVAWWPTSPDQPAASDVGRMAQRRITDASTKPFAKDRLSQLGASYAPGDTDLAWTRLTHWREQLAAVLDQPPYDPSRVSRSSERAVPPRRVCSPRGCDWSSTCPWRGATRRRAIGTTASVRCD